jgi:hypothetical protein
MNHCGHDHERRESRGDWDDVGHAAEDFARHIARDAQRFAARVAGHASEFARDFAREWRRFDRHGLDTAPLGDDVRAVLKDVQTFVSEVVDGVDGLLDKVMRRDSDSAAGVWSKIVTTREAACIACGRRIEPGEECHLRRRRDGRDFRCATCGPPPEQPKPEPGT